MNNYMKLYATIETTRGQSKKIGDNLGITIKLYEGNNYKYLIMQREDFLHVYEIVNKQGSGRLLVDSAKLKGKKDIFNRLETSNQEVIDEYHRVKGKSQKGECKSKDTNGNACYNCESGQGGECGSAEE